MDKTITVNIEDIATLHNNLCSLHPTGEDIMVVAQCILKLRKMAENANESEGKADE